MDRSAAESIARQVFEQFATMIDGQLRHNEAIIASDATIAHLRDQVEQANSTNANLQREHHRTQQELDRTNAMNANLQSQMNEMRDTVRQLQAAFGSLRQSQPQQDLLASQVPMDVDASAGNDAAWTMVGSEEEGIDDVCPHVTTDKPKKLRLSGDSGYGTV